MSETDEKQYTLIGLILFISCGLLVLIVLGVFVKRQVLRFKSRSEQHIQLGHNVPKKMKGEIRRRLNRTEAIAHEPGLLHIEAVKHSSTSTDFDAVPHLYRMKALDCCKLLESRLLKEKSYRRTDIQPFDKFLKLNLPNLPVKFKQSHIDELCVLYRHARHEPKPFGRELFNRTQAIVTELSNAIQGSRGGTWGIRPVADIDVIEGDTNTLQPQSHLTAVKKTVFSLAGRMFRSKQKTQEYQSVPSTESLEEFDETAHL